MGSQKPIQADALPSSVSGGSCKPLIWWYFLLLYIDCIYLSTMLFVLLLLPTPCLQTCLFETERTTVADHSLTRIELKPLALVLQKVAFFGNVMAACVVSAWSGWVSLKEGFLSNMMGTHTRRGERQRGESHAKREKENTRQNEGRDWSNSTYKPGDIKDGPTTT